MHGTEEASNDGRVRMRIIHGLNISHKELIYLLQKSTQPSKQSSTTHAPRGIDWQEKFHRSSPTATHKEDNQKTPHAPTSSHNGSPYVHATGLANLNTSISQFHNYSTSTTLISPPLYCKTIARNQTYHIQCTLYESFYYIPLGCLSYQD